MMKILLYLYNLFHPITQVNATYSRLIIANKYLKFYLRFVLNQIIR